MHPTRRILVTVLLLLLCACASVAQSSYELSAANSKLQGGSYGGNHLGRRLQQGSGGNVQNSSATVATTTTTSDNVTSVVIVVVIVVTIILCCMCCVAVRSKSEIYTEFGLRTDDWMALTDDQRQAATDFYEKNKNNDDWMQMKNDYYKQNFTSAIFLLAANVKYAFLSDEQKRALINDYEIRKEAKTPGLTNVMRGLITNSADGNRFRTELRM